MANVRQPKRTRPLNVQTSYSRFMTIQQLKEKCHIHAHAPALQLKAYPELSNSKWLENQSGRKIQNWRENFKCWACAVHNTSPLNLTTQNKLSRSS